MKRFALLPILLLLTGFGEPDSVFTIAWDYPDALLSESITFNVYASSNRVDWNTITNCVGTNLSMTVSVPYGCKWLRMTTSDGDAESEHSETLWLKPEAHSDSVRVGTLNIGQP